MSLAGLFELVQGAHGYREVRTALQSDALADLSLPDAAKPYVLGALWRDLAAPVLVVCPRPEDAQRLYEALLAYCGDDASIYHFAEAEVLPERWRRHYNESRPHSALGYLPPAAYAAALPP